MSLNWGNFPKPKKVSLIDYQSQQTFSSNKPSLPYGRGRSYGDVCLNDNGQLISTRYLDNFLHFDQEKGILRVQAGVTLAEILRVIIPLGWFLAVIPGTKFVTVGGAIANDIHGKNHHRKGTFGSWVRRIALLRSDQGEIECSPSKATALWQATIGGMGLTGMILWAELQLVPLANSDLLVQRQSFKNISEFYPLIDEAVLNFEYTVAWIDSQAKEKELGRGILLCANHLTEASASKLSFSAEAKVRIPVYCPSWILNRHSIRLFNTLYYRSHQKTRLSTMSVDQFFFPLDAVASWNLLYGSAGFLQYQLVIPSADREAVTREILSLVSRSGQGAFLSVAKTFGDKASPGLISFPLAGLSLALDFPYRGHSTLTLLNDLDKLVESSGGRLYTAKDARMSKGFFQRSYPAWQQLEALRDPLCQSNLWRRLMQV